MHPNAPDLTPNPVIASRRDSNGWTIRHYLNGMFDATHRTELGLSPGFDTYSELVAWIRGVGK